MGIVSVKVSALLCGAGLAFTAACASAAPATQPVAAPQFTKEIQPLLEKYCYDCHADGESKGGVALDAFKTDEGFLQNKDLWWRVLKNVRSGIMPPQKKPHPSGDEQVKLAEWIKYSAFGIDPKDVDPGRVTIHRLNRVEYRNTIRDLMGVDYNTTEEFPPDDTGYGFDTIADVLSISPILLEKYMKAAETIVRQSVPTVSKTVPITTLTTRDLKSDVAGITGDRMSIYKEATLRSFYIATQPSDYKVSLNLTVRGDFNFDPGKAQLVLKVDDVEQWHQEFGWNNGEKFHFDIPQKWEPGKHTLVLELHPLTPPEQRRTNVDLTIQTVQIEGPLDQKFWNVSKNYKRFFPREEVPADPTERAAYMRDVLRAFTTRAFRQPSDEKTVERLAKIAEAFCAGGKYNFEQGIQQAIIAALSSPRFLFRIERSEKGHEGQQFANIDNYSLASRLSYFLWSTMPDEELFTLAEHGELRKNYAAQVKRMMDDPRSDNMIRNFAGQWLQLRDVDAIAIDARVVLARDTGTDKDFQNQQAQFRAQFAGRNGQNPFAAANGAAGTPAAQGNGAAQANVSGANAGTGGNSAAATAQQPNAAAPNGASPAANTVASAAVPSVSTGAAIAATTPPAAANAGSTNIALAGTSPSATPGVSQGAAALTPNANAGAAGVAVAQGNGANPANPAGRRGNFQQRQRLGGGRFGRPAVELDGPLRTAMRQEPEMLFESIVRDNRSLSDLLDCNYTFVNANLAKVYGMQGITGTDMRKVELPKDSPRGGLLTMGSLLVVTSNPTRTSPVKRGQFILDNILGMPAPPPPADIPPLEDAEKGFKDREPTFREVLEMHRDKPLCKSCHARMDPLGLALENFNALGMYREKERGNSVDSSGQLMTGESFKNVQELKQILKSNHVEDFYRCLTEKMLTFALGRGLEYYDVEAVDRIVEQLKKQDGKFSALLDGVVNSVPFQERRVILASPARQPDLRAQVQP